MSFTKKNSTIFKTWASDINKSALALESLNKIKFNIDTISVADIKKITDVDNIEKVFSELQSISKADYGDFGVLKLQESATAVSGLSSELQASSLLMNGFTETEITTILATNNLTDSEIEQAIAFAQSGEMIKLYNAETIKAGLQNTALSSTEQKLILDKLGLIDATTGELITTKEISQAKLEEALVNIGLEQSEAAVTAERIISVVTQGTQKASIEAIIALTKKQIVENANYIASMVAAHPVATALGFALTALGAAILYNKHQEEEYQEALKESVSTMSTATSEYSQAASSLDELTEKYKTLKKQLDNTNLSEAETYQIKSDLYDVQCDLIDNFGDEAKGIDLVNGEYREQLGLLQQINKESADAYLTKNKEDYDKNISYLNDKEDFRSEYSSDWSSKNSGYMSDDLKKILEANGLTIDAQHWRSELGGAWTKYYVEFSDMTREEAYNAALNLGEVLRQAGEDNADLLDDPYYELVQSYLSYVTKDLIDEDELNSAKENTDYYEKLSAMYSSSFGDMYNSFVDARDKYLEALQTGEGIEEAKTNFDTIYGNFKDSSKAKSDEVVNAFDDVKNSIDNELVKLHDWEDSLNNSNVLDVLSKLNVTDDQLRGINWGDEFTSEAEEAFGNLLTYLGVSSDEIEQVISLLVKMGAVIGEVQGSTLGNETNISFDAYLKQIFGENSSLTDFTGQMSKLGDYLTKLKNNKITTEDIIALQDMGIVGNSIEDITKQLEDLMNTNLTGIISKIDDIIANTSNEDTKEKLQNLKDTLVAYNHEAQNTKEPSILSGNSTRDFQKLSSGFDQLDKIYADVYDKGTFDWSSILNNDEFFQTFGSFEDEYNSFIDTVSNSPSDLSACQDSFNNLVTAYVNGSGVLKEVTEATKASTIAQMEQMGITNASAVVEEYLTANEQARELETRAVAAATSDMSGATQTATQDLLAESEMSDLARTKLYQLVAQQTIFNSQTLDVNGKINALAELAKQYGDVTTAALASAAAQKADAYARAMATDEGASYIDSVEEYLESTYNDLVNSVNNFTPVNYAPKINYGGGSSTQKAMNDASNAAKDAAEETKDQFYTVFDWMEKKIEYLERIATKAIKRVTNSLQYALDKNSVSSTFKKINEQMSTNAYMVKRYESSANAVGLNSELKGKIKNGGNIQYYKDHNIHDDYGHIYDEELNKQIEAYSDWIQKSLKAAEANEQLKDSIKEVAEAMAQAPIEKYANKIEKYESSTELLDAKVNNYKTANGKNTQLDLKSKNINKTLNAYEDAYQSSKSNYNSYKKKVTGQKVAKGATKKEKTKYKNLMAKVKSYAKSGKLISDKLLESIYSYCSSVQNFSWYQNAVAYNEALNAKLSAEETYKLYKQTSKTEQRELAKEKFDNVVTEYDNKISLIDYGIQDLESQISLAETKGIMVNDAYYRQQKTINTDKLSQYKEEKSRLESLISSIEKGTQEWYDAKDQIQQCNSSIMECEQSTLELNNAIRDLNFEKFEKVAEQIERIIAEQNFLANLMLHEDMYDDNGSFTDYGLGTLGTHTNSYYAYLEKTKNDKAELDRLQEMLATGNLGDYNSTDQLRADIDKFYTTWQEDISNVYSAQESIFD